MPGSTRSSTINGDSDPDHQPREKSVDQGTSGTDNKQSLLGVDSEDLKATGQQPGKAVRADGKVELTEDEAYDKLGYTLPEWRKWSILVLILLIQTSMNSNASMYGFAVEGIAEEFGVSETKARLGQALFLIFYAFGCELWAPWSEELGRWPTREL
jgi:phage shock protein PspC (stress-responsive transcriptional regulator)